MSDKSRLVKEVAVGAICSMLSCIILTSILAAVMLSTGMLGSELTNWITTAIMGLGSLVGGFVAAKINKGAGIPVGGMTGLAVFVVSALASLSRGASGVTSMAIIKLAASVLLAIVGGILGIREKKGTNYGRF